MLLVPTTSVGYNQEKEEAAEQESKMARIAAIEEAKDRDRLLEQGGQVSSVVGILAIFLSLGVWRLLHTEADGRYLPSFGGHCYRCPYQVGFHLSTLRSSQPPDC